MRCDSCRLVIVTLALVLAAAVVLAGVLLFIMTSSFLALYLLTNTNNLSSTFNNGVGLSFIAMYS